MSVPWLSDAAEVTAATQTRQQSAAQDADTLILMINATMRRVDAYDVPARDTAHSFTAPLASMPDTKHKLKDMDLDEYSENIAPYESDGSGALGSVGAHASLRGARAASAKVRVWLRLPPSLRLPAPRHSARLSTDRYFRRGSALLSQTNSVRGPTIGYRPAAAARLADAR